MSSQQESYNLPIGPFHPLLEEAEYFKLKVEGEKVVGIEMETGWMHRGIERLCEQKYATADWNLLCRSSN